MYVYACVQIYIKSSTPKKTSYFAVETTATLPSRKITGMLGFCGVLPHCPSVLESV